MILTGVIAVAAGVLAIIFNRQIRDISAAGQRQMFGDKIAAKTRATPLWQGVVVGAIFIALGILFLVVGIVHS